MENTIMEWIRSVLEITPRRWLSLVQVVPSNLLRLQPKAQEWGAIACLQHLVDTERWVFPKRVQFLLDEQDFPAFDPDTQGTHSESTRKPIELAEEFNLLRQGSLVLLRKVSPADLEKKARHQELGLVTMSELLHEWAAHDLMHTVQAEQALMQPFIRGCGPWDKYFRAHDARY